MAIQGEIDMSGTKRNEITSFEKLRLKISGMRGMRIYEIVCDGDAARIDEYFVRYQNGKDVLELERSKQIETDVLIAKLGEFNLLAWDGFHGKHPKNVLDGDMFSLVATLNGKEIEADGSANFPNGYSEFMRFVGETLA